MSIQWLLSASFLYSEIALVVILLLPIISPIRWKKIINSRLIKFAKEKAGVLFIVFLLIQVVLLLDSLREVYKYQPVEEHGHHHHHDHITSDMAREFRAQRNLYITSMCLFLWFVIKRLLLLISNTASLLEQKETALDEVARLRRELKQIKEKQDTKNKEILSSKSANKEEKQSEAKEADEDNEDEESNDADEKKPLLKADLEEREQIDASSNISSSKSKDLSLKKED